MNVQGSPTYAAVLLLVAASACTAPGTSAESAEGDGERALPIDGSFTTRFRGRRTGDAEDLDLYGTLVLNAGDRKEDPYSAHLMGRVLWDVGGDDDEGVFAGLDDTYSSPQGTLYYAYVEAHELESVETLRLGRQRVFDTPETVVFDGALVETREIGDAVTLGVYGGVPAHFYESSPSGDAVLGFWGEGRPWTGGRLRLDYMYLRDDARLDEHQNDLIGLSLWQQVDEEITLEGEYTRLEGENRDARVRAHYAEADGDLTVQASYYTLLETQKNYALEADPLWATLKDFEPFHEFGVLASKGLGESARLDLGVDVRVLDDSSDEGEFNHEFGHYYATASLLDVLSEGLTISVTGDYWDDDQQDIRTWGLDATQEFDEDWRGSIGSYYSLYKYDLFLDSERDDVRTYYLKVRRRQSEALVLDGAFEYEDDDHEEYQTLRLGARWLF